MKIFYVFLFAVLLVGCASSPPSATLTPDQAKSLALKLANDKALTVYHCQPFRDAPAQFIAGKWSWTNEQGFGTGDIEATVLLSANGLKNNVDIKLLSNVLILSGNF